MRRSAEKFRPTHLQLAGNDTVPISVRHGGRMRSDEQKLTKSN